MPELNPVQAFLAECNDESLVVMGQQASEAFAFWAPLAEVFGDEETCQQALAYHVGANVLHDEMYRRQMYDEARKLFDDICATDPISFPDGKGYEDHYPRA